MILKSQLRLKPLIELEPSGPEVADREAKIATYAEAITVNEGGGPR
jgi:hypothetical protein